MNFVILRSAIHCTRSRHIDAEFMEELGEMIIEGLDVVVGEFDEFEMVGLIKGLFFGFALLVGWVIEVAPVFDVDFAGGNIKVAIHLRFNG